MPGLLPSFFERIRHLHENICRICKNNTSLVRGLFGRKLKFYADKTVVCSKETFLKLSNK